MLRRRTLYLLISLVLPQLVSAQAGGEWTLQRAVSYAQENSLQVRRLGNQTELAEINVRQSRNNRLPSLSGGTGVNLQLGRTIDPTNPDAVNWWRQQLAGYIDLGVAGFKLDQQFLRLFNRR